MPAQQTVARGTSTAHECSFACSSEFTILVYEAVVACLSAESQQTAEAAAAAVELNQLGHVTAQLSACGPCKQPQPVTCGSEHHAGAVCTLSEAAACIYFILIAAEAAAATA